MKSFTVSPVYFADDGLPVSAVCSRSIYGSQFHRHAGSDWEFCYVVSGKTRVQVGTRLLALGSGELLVIRPDDPHEFMATRGVRYTLIVRREFFRRLPYKVRCGATVGMEVDGVRIPERMHVTPGRRKSVEFLLAQLADESLGDDKRSGAMCASLLAQVFLEIARNVEELKRGLNPSPSLIGRETVVDLMKEIRATVEAEWSLRKMAQRSGYSATQLSILFKQVAGMTPCRWLSKCRVERAGDLLRDSDEDLWGVMLKAGFRSRSQFHRAFKDFLKMTPGHYRQVVRHGMQP